MKPALLLLQVLFFYGCGVNNSGKKNIDSPEGYNLGEPQKIFLSESLDEISGIVYVNPNEIVAVNDEEGKVFKINPSKSKLPDEWDFAKNGDFEDITFTGAEWYALKSNGDLYNIKNIFTGSITHEKVEGPFAESEFEGLYYDEGRKALMMLCKSCNKDNDKKEVSVFAFDVAAKTWGNEPVFRLNVNDIANKAGKDKLHFKPSAAAINPAGKNLYILSSANKLLVVADADGQVKKVYSLPPGNFKQPEGISFAPNGDMYISNEASEGTANILLFKYNKEKK